MLHLPREGVLSDNSKLIPETCVSFLPIASVDCTQLGGEGVQIPGKNWCYCGEAHFNPSSRAWGHCPEESPHRTSAVEPESV